MDVSSEVEGLVVQLIRDEHGDAAVREPDSGGNATPFPKPAEWPLGLAAVAGVHRTVESLLRDWVHAARGDGLDWAHIAEAIGETAHESPRAAADAAFAWAAPDPHWPGDVVATIWRCASCGEWVRDHGPRDLGFESVEEDHAPDCHRYQPAALAEPR